MEWLSALGVAISIATLLIGRNIATRIIAERRVHASLVRKGITQSQLSITLVVNYSDAASLEDFIRHISQQRSEGVVVFVVFDHSTSSRERAARCRCAGMRYGVPVQTARISDSQTLSDLVRRRAKTDLVLQLSSKGRVSPRFFEYVSMAFTQPVAAVNIGRSVQLDRTLTNAGLALLTLIKEAVWSDWLRSPRRKGVHPYTVLRMDALGTSYRAVPLLRNWYRVEVPLPLAPAMTWTIWAILLSGIMAAVLWLMAGVDATILIGSVVSILVLLSIIALIFTQKNETVVKQVVLVLIAPFFPLIILLGALRELGRLVTR